MKITEISSELNGVKVQINGYVSLCSTHIGTTPSLSVTEDKCYDM